MAKGNETDYFVIDLAHIGRSLVRRIWAIALSAVVGALLGLLLSTMILPPKYESSVLLYVNIGAEQANISSSELSAAQSIVKTSVVILNNRTTMEAIIHEANVPYTYEEIQKQIRAGSESNTEVLRVTVTSRDPYEANNIANAVAEVLPERIEAVMRGASMEVIDPSTLNLKKASPSVKLCTALGLVIGAVLSAAVVAVLALLDNTVHSGDYVLSTYDFPVLAEVPNLLESHDSKYGYYNSARYAKRKGGTAE